MTLITGQGFLGLLASLLDHPQQMFVGLHLLVHKLLSKNIGLPLLRAGIKHELLIAYEKFVPDRRVNKVSVLLWTIYFLGHEELT